MRSRKNLVWSLTLALGIAQAADAPPDPQAIAWKQLRDAYPDRIAAYDAVPYSSRYHPEIAKAFKDNLEEIEDLRRRLTQLILQGKRCDAIEQVLLDTAATHISDKEKHLAFRIDCEGGTTYHADAEQIRAGDIPPADKKGQWRKAEARTICEEVIRANGPSRQKPHIIDTQVDTDDSGAYRATVIFEIKSNQPHPETHTAKCTFAPGEYPRVTIE